jgi:hypothetical protein
MVEKRPGWNNWGKDPMAKSVIVRKERASLHCVAKADLIAKLILQRILSGFFRRRPSCPSRSSNFRPSSRRHFPALNHPARLRATGRFVSVNVTAFCWSSPTSRAGHTVTTTAEN